MKRSEINGGPAPSSSFRSKEKKLVRLAQRGDKDAFQRLASRYYRNVYGLALTLCKDREEAADVTQEAVVKAYRKIRAYRHQAPFSSWLLQITRNAFIDRVRKSAQLRDKHDRMDRESVGPSPEDPEALLGRKDTAEMVRCALARVAEPYREAVHLFDIQGLSYQEVADVCDVPIGTIKSRLRRGRDALRRELVEAGALGSADSGREERKKVEGKK
jgi:RNA polymerase sigma-70 factor (ECF subfamily)